MPSSAPHPHGDEPFDVCFRTTPAVAPSDLGDRVMASIEAGEQEDPLDPWMDESLAAWPASPTAHFTEHTLNRARVTGQTSKIVFWRLASPLAAGLAACVALVWAFPGGDISSTSKTPALPSVRAVASIDPTAAEILALAESLDQPARWLLDDAHLNTLVAAVE